MCRLFNTEAERQTQQHLMHAGVDTSDSQRAPILGVEEWEAKFAAEYHKRCSLLCFRRYTESMKMLPVQLYAVCLITCHCVGRYKLVM